MSEFPKDFEMNKLETKPTNQESELSEKDKKAFGELEQYLLVQEKKNEEQGSLENFVIGAGILAAGEKGLQKKTSRRGFLKAALGIGAAAAASEMLSPKEAEAQGPQAVGEILASRERSKAYIENLKAQEFIQAVQNLCRFINENMRMLNTFVRGTLFRKEEGPKGKSVLRTVQAAQITQLNLRVGIIEDTLRALKGKITDTLPVPAAGDYKEGKIEKGGEVIGAVGGVAGEVIGNRRGGQVVRDTAESARRTAEAAENARLQKEQYDRFAGMQALNTATSTLENVQRAIDSLITGINTQVANPDKLIPTLNSLSADLFDTSGFVNDKLSEDVKRPRRNQ